jgi:aconitate hydratase
VIAESFERIHRSNLVMMGVLPLQFLTGDTAEKLGLIGNETFKIVLNSKTANVSASSPEHQINFTVQVRFDAPIDAEYFKASGILPYVISEKMK